MKAKKMCCEEQVHRVVSSDLDANERLKSSYLKVPTGKTGVVKKYPVALNKAGKVHAAVCFRCKSRKVAFVSLAGPICSKCRKYSWDRVKHITGNW